MLKYFKPLFRFLIPRKLRHLILKYYPKIYKVNTYLLKRAVKIEPLSRIDEKFYIKQLSISDANRLHKAYGNRPSFNINILPRLRSTQWVGLGVINSENDEIAYVSWVIKNNTDFINEFGIHLKHNQFFLRHGYCVPDYRHQGFHTRMEQERINYCIFNGATEIFIQIGRRNNKGINSVINNGFTFYQRNFVIYIGGLGIYRELFSFLRNPFRRII